VLAAGGGWQAADSAGMPASPPAVSTPAVLSTSATVSAMEERELRVRLGYWLQGQGACNTERFLKAFQEVPRHELVREGWFIGWDGSRIHSRDCTAEEWMNILYHDMPVFIRDEGPMLSSSSMPSIMGRMLDLLRVEDGSTVLEIGTGSGYNAALLCHRLGSELVTSIDVQADIVEMARERLSALGYEPYLATADGLTGYPPRARYDRVIGTCYACRSPWHGSSRRDPADGWWQSSRTGASAWTSGRTDRPAERFIHISSSSYP
jgi:protein-L-isoaspartate O-methyltransferase